MKVVLLSCIFASASLFAAGAPAPGGVQPGLSQQQIEQYLRNRRSQYANQYVAPCAAGSMSPVTSPAYQLEPHEHYAYRPRYRSVDAHLADPELLSFSEFDHFLPEHMPIARMGGYGVAPAHMSPSVPAMNQILPATTATVYGVFPNANVGGYNVPLLFSCSPTIVPGHMMEAQSPATSIVPAPDSYRGVDEHSHVHDLHTHHEESSSEEHLSTLHEPSKVVSHPQ